MEATETPWSALKDEEGRDVQLVYSVTLSYVVNAVCPCTEAELAELVQDRIRAGGGVQPEDIEKSEIIAVERI